MPMTSPSLDKKFSSTFVFTVLWQWNNCFSFDWFLSIQNHIEIILLGFLLSVWFLPLKIQKWTRFSFFLVLGLIFASEFIYLLAVWIVFEILLYAVFEPPKIIFFMSVNIFCFIVLQTFTEIDFTKQVIFIACIGLCSTLRSPSIKGAYLFFFSLCAVFVFVGLVGENADAKKRTSGYRINDTQLGGSFDFNQDPVMKVRTKAPATYWRGEVKSYYTGKGWEDGELNQAISQPKSTATTPYTYSFEMLNNQDYPMLFTAFTPQKASMKVFENLEGELWIDQLASRTKEYTLQAHVYEPSSSELHSVSMKDYDVLPRMYESYLQTPKTLPSRVSDLAKRITEQFHTPQEKVEALATYLKTSYTYTNTPKQISQSTDFVDQFLFDIKEGYCDYFSTAMTIMTRTLGIPARWVKGYTSGQKISVDTYLVTNADAHSWVEVYFPKYGWVRVEPTPGFLPASLNQDIFTIVLGFILVLGLIKYFMYVRKWNTLSYAERVQIMLETKMKDETGTVREWLERKGVLSYSYISEIERILYSDVELKKVEYKRIFQVLRTL